MNMLVSEVMTPYADYILPSTTLDFVAQKMRDLNCGFFPVSDIKGNRLQGVITDRDITVRAVAYGLNPAETEVGQVISDKVLYCFSDDDIASAADTMVEQNVYRLVVLDNKENKMLCGILSLGDIMRSDLEGLGGKVAKSIICSQAA